MLQNDINITAICVGKNILPIFNTAIILKSFYEISRNTFTTSFQKVSQTTDLYCKREEELLYPDSVNI